MLECFVIFLVIVLVLATIAGAAAYIIWHYRSQWREDRREFKSALVNRLRKQGSTGFDIKAFAEECQVSSSMASQVGEELYIQVCTKAAEDGEISTEERSKLDRLARTLSLDKGRTQEFEEQLKGRRYADAAQNALADGKITESERQDLEQLRKNFGIGRSRAFDLSGGLAADGYLALFRSVVSDGQITDAELHELYRYRNALAMSEEQALALVRPSAAKLYSRAFGQIAADGEITNVAQEQLRRFRNLLGLSEREASEIVLQQALEIYREIFYEILQDGVVSQDEELRLQHLQRQLSLTNHDVRNFLRELEETKSLGKFRRGELPSLKTRHILESGEICHWVGECTFAWATATKGKNTVGELIVTSNRIIFTSAVKSFEFSPTKIVDVEGYSNGLSLSTSISKGGGDYLTSDARALEAILVGVVRKHKYLLSETFSSSRTRHIPDSVKREVWFRDGGHCVRCSSDQYLEFDHIIAHAKGGANTLNNIQILCRGCNALKSDRI